MHSKRNKMPDFPILTSSKSLARVADAILQRPEGKSFTKEGLLSIIAEEICGAETDWDALQEQGSPLVDPCIMLSDLPKLQSVRIQKDEVSHPHRIKDPSLQTLISDASREAFAAMAEGDVNISRRLLEQTLTEDDLEDAISGAVEDFLHSKGSEQEFQQNARDRGAGFVITYIVDFHFDLLSRKVEEIINSK